MNVRTWFRAALVGAATFAITAGAAIAQSEMTDKIRLESAAPAAQYDFAVTGGFLALTKVGGNGRVGIGTTTPLNDLSVFGTDGDTQISAEDTLGGGGDRVLFRLKAASKIRFSLNNTAAAVIWTFDNDGNFTISDAGDGINELILTPAGNMTLLGTLTSGSDVNRKTDIVPLGSQSILDKVASLPISEWSYKDEPAVRHVGPMAQDFHAAFGLGNTDKGIAVVDADGVSLASIQALYELVREQREQIESLQARLQQLESKN